MQCEFNADLNLLMMSLQTILRYENTAYLERKYFQLLLVRYFLMKSQETLPLAVVSLLLT